jgi:hypothetical protein
LRLAATTANHVIHFKAEAGQFMEKAGKDGGSLGARVGRLAISVAW